MSERVACYIRVSTDEQRKTGYSIPDQRRVLREHARREGFEVVEEIVDDGFSGGDPHRPGLRRVMELASGGAIDLVLATKRDRLFRSRLYRLLWDRDLEELGVRMVALTDAGNRFADAMMDEFAEFEKDQISQRTRDGLEQKVRGGEVVRSSWKNFGFDFSEDGNSLVPDDEELAVLIRLFEGLAAGRTAGEVTREFEAMGILTPTGLTNWNARTVTHLLESPLYRPLSAAEAGEMVTPEVAAKLEDGRVYGLWTWGRREIKRWREWDVEKDAFVTRSTSKDRPPEEWLYVPIDVTHTGLSRATVDRAREMVKARYRKPSKAGGRSWQLKSVLRCGECGAAISPHTSKRKLKDGTVRPANFYYVCRAKYNDSPRDCGHTTSYPAASLEERVWGAVFGILSEPDSLRKQHERHMSRLREELRGDPDKEVRELTGKAEKLERRRSGYIDLAADGDLDRDELRDKLAEVDMKRRGVEEELKVARSRHRTMEEAERSFQRSIGIVEHLDRVTYLTASPEDRRRIYMALRMKAYIYEGGEVRLHGILDPEVRLLDAIQDGPDMGPRSEPGEGRVSVVGLDNTRWPSLV